MPELEDIVYSDDDEDVGVKVLTLIFGLICPVSPIPTIRVHKDHPVKQIIRDLNLEPQTRRMTKNLGEHGLFSSVQQRTNHKDFQSCLFACFLSQEEPKKVIHALKDPSWIEAMQEELLQFMNKKDKRGIVIKNKARLVAQGYTQEEGIDYDEMDSRVLFLYGKIEKGILCMSTIHPQDFEDPDFPDRVYKVEKALYGLHQAPRAWYETLSTYLLDNGFQRGKIDKTLFIRRDKGDILLVQVYVDDIIFGSTKKSLCTEFEKMMHKKFQMSSMGELTFFLGLQVKQKNDGIFISQDKKSTTGGCQFLGSRLISWQCKKQTVVANSTTEAEYVAASSCCGQVLWIQNQLLDYGFTYKASDLQALMDGKKIIITEASVRRDLQLNDEEGTDCLPNATIFEELTRIGYEKLLQKLTFYKAFFSPQWKFLINTILQFLSAKTTAWNEFSSTMDSAIIYLATNQKFNFSKYIFESMVKNLENVSLKKKWVKVQQILLIHITHPPLFQPSTSQPQRKQKPRKPKRKDTEVPQLSGPTDNVADEVVYEEIDDSLERVATTATSLDAEQDRGNINKTQSKATLNEPSSLGTSSEYKDCSSLENYKFETKSQEVRKERRINETQKIIQGMVDSARDRSTFWFMKTPGEERIPSESIITTSTLTTTTVATTIIAVNTRPKAKGLVIHEEEQATTPTVSSQQPSQVKARDKGKWIMVEEHVKMKKKYQISLDEELAFKLQAEEEEERLAREKAQQIKEANIVAWDNVQAMIDVDYQMAQ
ncbi:putative ribonuclease H-like domain-containing protein [Tanacetum coccineum]